MRTTVLGIAALLALVSAGCAVGAEGEPHVIAADDVPYGLLDDERQQTTTTVPDGVAVDVYFARGDRLVAVTRSLPPDSTLLDILDVLAQGPDDAERRAGLISPVPDAGAFRDVAVVRGVAEVQLGQTFVDLTGEDQVLAIAQAVLTLTGRPGIGRVGFTVDGDPVEAPRGDGSVSSDPVARDDFASLLGEA